MREGSYLFCSWVDGLVGLSADGIYKLSVDEYLMGKMNLSAVGMEDRLHHEGGDGGREAVLNTNTKMVQCIKISYMLLSGRNLCLLNIVDFIFCAF